MEAQRSKVEKADYKKAICPKCGKPINFMTRRKLIYEAVNSKADSKVWCNNCSMYVKFIIQ